MGVPFKKIPRRDPRKEDAVAKFYPQLVTLGDNADLEDVAYVMKEKSSLTLGDIKSVITNFVEALIDKLYEGSRQMFLASFLKSEKISAAELEEIRRMIEEEEK